MVAPVQALGIADPRSGGVKAPQHHQHQRHLLDSHYCCGSAAAANHATAQPADQTVRHSVEQKDVVRAVQRRQCAGQDDQERGAATQTCAQLQRRTSAHARLHMHALGGKEAPADAGRQ